MTEDNQWPAGWSIKTIEELAVPKGIAYGVLKPGPSTDRGVPMLRVGDVRNGQINRSAIYRISHELDEEFKRTKLRGGEVVLSIQGSVGRAAVVPRDLAGANLSRTLAMIRLREPKLGKWLHRALESPQVQASMRQLVGGTTRDSLNLRDLRTIEIPIAPEPIRSSLIQLLEHTDSLTHSSSRHLSAAHRAVRRFELAVLTAASSGRLTVDWREENPDQLHSATRLVSTLRRDSPASRRQPASGSIELAEDLPAGWQSARGFDVFAFVTSGSRGWARYYSDSGPLFLRVGNLDYDSIALDLNEIQHVRPPANAETKRALVRPNDLLISITAEVGMVAVVPADMKEAYVNQHVAIARPHPAIDSRYLATFIAARDGGQMQLESLQRGATKAGLRLDDIRSLVIPLPSPAEQGEIVRRVDRLFALANQLERRTNLASTQITRASEAVVAKAFRGEFSLNGHRLVNTEIIGSRRK